MVSSFMWRPLRISGGFSWYQVTPAGVRTRAPAPATAEHARRLVAGVNMVRDEAYGTILAWRGSVQLMPAERAPRSAVPPRPRRRGAERPARGLRMPDSVRGSSTTTYPLPSVVRTRIVPPNGACGLEQVSWLSPYTAETIGQAAWRAGPRARLEVIVPPTATAENIAGVQQLFAWLAEREIVVTVRRGSEAD